MSEIKKDLLYYLINKVKYIQEYEEIINLRNIFTYFLELLFSPVYN